MIAFRRPHCIDENCKKPGWVQQSMSVLQCPISPEENRSMPDTAIQNRAARRDHTHRRACPCSDRLSGIPQRFPDGLEESETLLRLAVDLASTVDTLLIPPNPDGEAVFPGMRLFPLTHWSVLPSIGPLKPEFPVNNEKPCKTAGTCI